MGIQATPVSEDLSRATAAVLERLAGELRGKVFSPRVRLLDLEAVCEATTLGERTIERMIAEERFPKPQDGIGKRVWRESAIIAWNDRNDPNEKA